MAKFSFSSLFRKDRRPADRSKANSSLFSNVALKDVDPEQPQGSTGTPDAAAAQLQSRAEAGGEYNLPDPPFTIPAATPSGQETPGNQGLPPEPETQERRSFVLPEGMPFYRPTEYQDRRSQGYDYNQSSWNNSQEYKGGAADEEEEEHIYYSPGEPLSGRPGEALRRRKAEQARREAEQLAAEKAREEARRRMQEEIWRSQEESMRQRRAAAEAAQQQAAAEEARRKAAAADQQQAAEEARRQAAAAAQQQAAEEARRKAEEAARQQAAEEARRKAAEAEQQRAAEEAERQAAEAARKQAAGEARRKAAEAEQQRAAEEAERQAAAAVRQQAAEEERRKAAAAAQQRAAEAAQRQTAAAAQQAALEARSRAEQEEHLKEPEEARHLASAVAAHREAAVAALKEQGASGTSGSGAALLPGQENTEILFRAGETVREAELRVAAESSAAEQAARQAAQHRGTAAARVRAADEDPRRAEAAGSRRAAAAAFRSAPELPGRVPERRAAGAGGGPGTVPYAGFGVFGTVTPGQGRGRAAGTAAALDAGAFSADAGEHRKAAAAASAKAHAAKKSARGGIGVKASILLYFRQLIGSFFTHTTLNLLMPRISLKCGPCYPSTMPLPYFVTGALCALPAVYLPDYGRGMDTGVLALAVLVAVSGLNGFRGLGRIFMVLSQRRMDNYIKIVSAFIFAALFVCFYEACEAAFRPDIRYTLVMGAIMMLSACAATSVNLGCPQDPVNSFGTLRPFGLFFSVLVTLLVLYAVFSPLLATSLAGIALMVRTLCGVFFARHQLRASRTNVCGVMYLTLLLLLADLFFMGNKLAVLNPRVFGI